jgi:selenide,water dikinase
LSPEALAQVLRPMQDLFKPADYPDLLVGLGSPDDAAVYRLNDSLALILTTDFFTPVVDDPYDYGAVAAANALSDVYAMGGQPKIALNIAAFPSQLPTEVLSQVMMGMAETVYQAGAAVAGGHTIQDKEPKVGLCVAGLAHPAQLLTKDGARVGDKLILTKPLGSGIITTAAKVDLVSMEHLNQAVAWMKRLNRGASEVAVALGLHGGTDITGFGLLGHAWEMAAASKVGLHFSFDEIPFMEGAQGCAGEGLFPGGSAANYYTYSPQVHFLEGIGEDDRMLLFDAQTSGGLLLAVPAEKEEAFRSEMLARDEPFWVIGQAAVGEAGIRVT